MDGGPAQRTGQDTMDELKHLAKVRVAGSNPVFRSRETSLLAAHDAPRLQLDSLDLAHHCPSIAHDGNDGRMDTVRGSIRQRGSGSFELRVYAGTDPSTGRAPMADAHNSK